MRRIELLLVLALVACRNAPERVASVPSPPPPMAASPQPLRVEPVEVLRQYYKSIQARDYAAAYAQWGGDGKASGKSLSEFEQGFSATRSAQVQIKDPGTIEGAAGSLYVEIPVEVNAELTDGTRQHFTGSYVLRRVNDVPGSTLEQRRWHLQSASLQLAR